MLRQLKVGLLALVLLPFIQGCDERDVATGVAVGAVVGGTVVAIASDNYYHDGYYKSRYDNYYRYRRARYNDRYRNRYDQWRGPRRGHRPPKWGYRITPASYGASNSVNEFAKFYSMPVEAAEIFFQAQNQAMNGNLQGLVEIGLFANDFQRLANMEKPSRDTLYRMSLRTGLDEDHLLDILTDFQQELLALQKAGKVQL